MFLKVTFRLNIRHLQTSKFKIHKHAILEYISLSVMLQSVKLQGTTRYDYDNIGQCDTSKTTETQKDSRTRKD